MNTSRSSAPRVFTGALLAAMLLHRATARPHPGPHTRPEPTTTV
ncbi:hypothetical protein [Streptomyces sp. Tu 2975]|nr:hypothetical protein [Streptomyces sp. Tu 2975]